MRRIVGWGLTAAVLLIASGAAVAQDVVAGRSQSSKQTDAWPASGAVLEGTKLYLVTQAEPKRRQTCVVKSLDLDEILCKRHGGKVAVYSRNELVAVVRAGASRMAQHIVQGLLVMGGVAIWAGYFVGPVCPAGGITLRVVGGLLVFVGFESLAWDNDDYSEQLLFLQPGETLQVKLR